MLRFSKPFRFALPLVVWCCAPFFAHAQATIKGAVYDDANEAVPYASVVLYNESDSTLLNGTATDIDGRFDISAQAGNYYVNISFLSLETKILAVKNLQAGETRNLGNITMSVGTHALKTVDVVAEKSQMELQLDKRVFNVGKDLSNAGSNTQEILANVPSVNVDVEGNVSLRGSENVRILIDGKPSGLTGAGNTDALRMLQGNLIEKVEVITNPSSRYDAEGEVGIINIVLKKEQRQGVNGAFEVTAGWPHNYGASFSLNYRKKWVNLFASNGTTYRASPGWGSSLNDYNGPDTVYHFESKRDQVRSGLSNVSRVGADFFINDKNTLTSSLLYKHADGKNTVDIDYRDMNASKEVFMNTLREEAELEAGRTLEGSLLYKKTFARQGREWTTLVSVIRDDDVESSDLVQTTTLTGLAPTQSLQRTANTENQRDYLAQTDYIHPFGKKGKVEGGAKITLREIENAYSVEVNNTGAWVALPDFTNELAYTENIYAAYAMFSNQYKRLTYQAGVRSEYSDIRTELVKTAQVNPRQYLNFFPSAHLSLELDERNALQTSYTRRLSRPSFRQLIPFFAYSDPRSFFGGNPDLNPEYTDSYEAGYLKKFENGSLLSSLYYRHTSNPTERITATDTTGLIRRFPVNLATKDAYGIEMNLQYEFTRWWRASASINAYQEYVQGEYRGRLYTSDALTFTGRAMMNFKLPYEINGQVSGNYTAPRRNIQGTILSRYTLDVGLSRDILKGNGTVIFSAKNVLNSNKMRSLVDTEYLYSESEFLWRARQFTLTFTYRLNQKKKPTRESMSPGFEGGEEM